MGEVLDERYELVGQIGTGGMGAVWEAIDRARGRRVAVKILHESLSTVRGVPERFLREARAAQEARWSTHIVEVFDVVQPAEGMPYIVMELLEGEDLHHLVERDGALDPRRAVDLMIQTCHALSEVHRHGLVHRDIKPGNLFVTRLDDGTEWLKLLDFGLVKISAKEQGQRRKITDYGVTVGTVQYMAPEQAHGPSEVDERADVFSCGVVLYVLLTNAEPYDPERLGFDGMLAKRKATPILEHRPDLDAGLAAVVERALAFNPAKRWESTEAFAEALAPYASPGASPVVEPSESFDARNVTIDELIDPRGSTPLIADPPDRHASGDEERGRMTPVLILGILLASVLISAALIAAFGSGDPIGDGPDVSADAARERRARPADRRRARRGEGPDAQLDDARVAPVSPREDAGAPPDAGTPDPLPRAPAPWIRRNLGPRLTQTLEDLQPAIGHCLSESGRPPGSKVLVHVWVEDDGALAFRKSVPRLSHEIRDCLTEALDGVRFDPTHVQKFVATHRYRVPR